MHTAQTSHAAHSISAAWEAPAPSGYARAPVAATSAHRPVATPHHGDRYSPGELSIHMGIGTTTAFEIFDANDKLIRSGCTTGTPTRFE